jgi:23S rRNA (guanosine2251-2'-O)-methyltransferase
MQTIYGIHAVLEALKSRGRSFQYVAVARNRSDEKLARIIADCRASGVPVRFLERYDLERLAQTDNHQGVVAVTASKKYADLDDILGARRGQHAFVLVLDGVEDPHNLGAILRTADAAGADGVVLPERRAAGVTGAVAKVSAGASEHLTIARVTNVARAIEEMKAKNFWVVGLDERGTQSYEQVDYKMDCALVLGAEGKGLHEHVRRHCDFLVSIPMLGQVASLNVSVAAGVVMYEMVRQRRADSEAVPQGKK